VRESESLERGADLGEAIKDGFERHADLVLPRFEVLGDLEALLEDAGEDGLAIGDARAAHAEELAVDAFPVHGRASK
jgi:hypothetical protein